MAHIARAMRLGLLLLSLPGFASIALGGGDASAAGVGDRPNIVLVMPDDVGYGDFACLGNPIIRTPHLDAFHRQSVRFTDFHVSPTCAPTRCALLTGRHEFKSGVTHTVFERERMSLKATTLAQVLKSAGYATGSSATRPGSTSGTSSPVRAPTTTRR